jgi:lysophospholipase L1-like esterase
MNDNHRVGRSATYARAWSAAALLTGLLFASHATAEEPAATAGPRVHFLLVGDSTVTDQAGWGEAFADRLLPPARCTNAARGGQSTKSFLDGGYWTRALALHPTHVLIQFGHNDMPGKGPARETNPKTTYRANLLRFVDEARAAGAQPILVTSIPRRNFIGAKLRTELAPYVEAMKEVAAEKKVPLADLNARSIEAIERLGPEASEELGPIQEENGKRDHTHLAGPGKELTARLLVAELRRVAPELSRFFRPEQESTDSAPD